MNKAAAFYFLLSIFLVSGYNTYAQVYYFKKYTTSDGLIQGTVNDIYQDSFGRIWFGTVDGLSIYDGVEFQNFQEQDGLKVSVISDFLELSPGIMLVGTFGNGIGILLKPPYQKDTLIASINDKKYLVNNEVNKIKRDPYGNIWICTQGGLTKWTITGNSITSIIHQQDFGDIGKLAVSDVVFADKEIMYLATDKGLVKYSGNKYEIIFTESIKEYELIHYLYLDRNKTLWFSSLRTLYFMKDGLIKPYKINDIEIGFPSNSIVENKNGDLIIGSLGRLIIINKDGTRIIDKKNGFNEKSVLALMFDREENLWIASLEGASKLNKSNFRFVDNNNVVLNFPRLMKTEKRLLIGNSDGIYSIENFILKPEQRFRNFKSTRVLDYLRKADEEWFATDRGVYYQHENKRKLFSVQDGLPHNFVYTIAKDHDDILWIMTQGGVAYIKNYVVYNFKDKIEKAWKYSDENCQSVLNNMSDRNIVVDHENNKWLGTWRGGLLKISGDSVYRFTEKDGIADLRIRSLYLDSSKVLWIGTRFNGVYRFDGKSFVNYSAKDGLNSNWVFSICEDDNRNYWFSTSKGVCRFDGNTFIQYGATEGILGGEILFSCYYNKLIWFNSWDQIFCFVPDRENFNPAGPSVYFKQIHLLEGKIPLNSNYNTANSPDINKLLIFQPKETETKINYGNNTIVFEFAGTSFRSEGRVSYKYKLEGFDNNWIASSKRNYITYTHLPPGRYKFIVYAVNREGIKSPSPATFAFTILPPFWQTWWFISLSVLFFIFIISLVNYLIYQYKIRQAIKVERLRTKISTDLHDEIGTGLSSIAIFAELIKRESKIGTVKTADMLKRIENTSRDLIDKMSDIVWAINPGNDTFEDALMKLKDYSVKILESKGINVELNLETVNEKIILPMVVRRNLLSIFKEAVTNAAKYSNASTIKLNLRFFEKPEKKIFLSVVDNGIGFDLNTQRKGYGLKNIEQRSLEMGAELEISSSPGKGTVLKVEIPIP